MLEIWGWLIVLLTLALAVLNMARRPWGDWDAIMIWTARARFIDRAGELWPVTFKLPTIHPDYPLMLPLAIVRLWRYIGSEPAFAPQTVSLTFFISSLLILWGTLALTRGRLPAWLGLMALLSNPFYMNYGSLQLADVPVGVCFMAGWSLVVLVMCHDISDTGNRLGWWGVSGALFGMTAGIKNEGLLMVLASFVALGMICLWRHGRLLCKKSGGFQEDVRKSAALLAGFIPFAGMVLWAKLMLTASNDLVRGQSVEGLILKPLNMSRHQQILDHYWGMLSYHWPLWSSVLLVGLVPLAGWSGRTLGRALCGMGAAIFMTAAGYYMVYLLTPLDLNWQLNTSLDRVMIQMWPAFVLWAMLGMRLPARFKDEISCQAAQKPC